VRAVRLLRAGLAAILLCTLGGASSPGAEDIIILGAAVSLTGKYALNGANTKNGYELAVHKINDKGGVSIGGRSYRFVVRYYDDESTPARGTELAERLVKQDGVKFMLGPYSSGLTKAILPVVEKYKVPMVEGTARRASCSPKASATFSPCSPPPTNISRPPSISRPSMPTSSARPRKR